MRTPEVLARTASLADVRQPPRIETANPPGMLQKILANMLNSLARTFQRPESQRKLRANVCEPTLGPTHCRGTQGILDVDLPEDKYINSLGLFSSRSSATSQNTSLASLSPQPRKDPRAWLLASHASLPPASLPTTILTLRCKSLSGAQKLQIPKPNHFKSPQCPTLGCMKAVLALFSWVRVFFGSVTFPARFRLGIAKATWPPHAERSAQGLLVCNYKVQVGL